MQTSRVYYIYLAFFALTLFSILGLDYIQWKKGEKSYLFSVFVKKGEISVEEKSLEQVVLEQTTAMDSESISQYRDSEGILHIKIDLSLQQYENLKFILEEKFSQINATISKEEMDQKEGRKYFLWRVKNQKDQFLSLLFSYPVGLIPKKAPVHIIPSLNKVVLIVDDMGNSLAAINEIISLNQPLTIAILPFSPWARETESIALQNNLEVIIHLPLESLNNIYDNNNTKGLIHSGMTKTEIIEVVTEDLNQIPRATGVNNHMGSKITSNKEWEYVILLKQP